MWFCQRYVRVCGVAAATLLAVSSSGHVLSAQSKRPTAERLIGFPVISADGLKVGQVLEILAADGVIRELRVLTSSPLGFGERIVLVPRGAFGVVDQTIVLDLAAGDIDALPTVTGDQDGSSKDR